MRLSALLAAVTLATGAEAANMPYTHSFLALGDSYTVGEGLATHASWPAQLVEALTTNGIPVQLKTIAQTGWTTDELAEALARARRQRDLRPCYDLVSLSVGVNNQYRGRPVDTFGSDFGALLRQAVTLAGGDPGRVLVLSIPDWSHSPFALSRGADRMRVGGEIDAYNLEKKALVHQLGAHWIDVTPGSRQPQQDFAADGLHPGPRAYLSWAELALSAATKALEQEPRCPPSP